MNLMSRWAQINSAIEMTDANRTCSPLSDHLPSPFLFRTSSNNNMPLITTRPIFVSNNIAWSLGLRSPRPGPLYRVFDINLRTYARVAPFIFLFFSPRSFKIIFNNWYQPDPHSQFNTPPPLYFYTAMKYPYTTAALRPLTNLLGFFYSNCAYITLTALIHPVPWHITCDDPLP